MAKKTNGKRLSPSVERQIALALVRVIECGEALGRLAAERSLDAGGLNPEYVKAETDYKVSFDEAKKVLADNGYDKLESIASRVAALENQLTAAISLRDGKEISRLGAALDRAKAGKPPLVVVEKKASKPAETRKPRIANAVKNILHAFDSETLADATGRIVTSIKADDTGKGLLVQFDNQADWTGVDPEALKVVTAAKGSGTPGNLSDASV